MGLIDGSVGVEVGEGLDVDLVSMLANDWGKKMCPSGVGGLLVYVL